MRECCVIGGGASLEQTTLEKLGKIPTIAVNAVYRILPFWPCCIIFTDNTLYKNIQEELGYLKSLKYTTIPEAVERGCKKITCSVEWQGIQRPDVGALYYGKKGFTGTAAISLALGLGYERLYLVGFDGEAQVRNRWKARDIGVDRYKGSDEDLKPFQNYQIINCSRRSRIPWFVKKDMRDCSCFC